MKPISQKVVEAGLIPKHTLLLFKRWGYLDPEATEIPETGPAQRTAGELRQGFTQFVEELDTLLETKAEEDIKETRFSITLRDPFRIRWLWEKSGNRHVDMDTGIVVIFRDEADRMIFPPSKDPVIGREFEMVDGSGDWYEITSCIRLWYGDTLYAYQVEAVKFR